MTKYRIKEYKNAVGNSRYYPQKRLFIFWFYFNTLYILKYQHRVYGYYTCYDKDNALTFTDLKEAENFIVEIKTIDKNKEENEWRKEVKEINIYEK